MTDREREEDGGRVVLTAGKLLGYVIGSAVAILTLTTWIYTTILDSKLERMELRMNTLYATKIEVLGRTEYELRQAERVEAEKRISERTFEAQRRIETLENRLTNLEARSRK